VPWRAVAALAGGGATSCCSPAPRAARSPPGRAAATAPAPRSC
jgi:hypothetical protein